MDWKDYHKTGVVHGFSEKDIVKGGGYISSQYCGNTEMELGTVYADLRIMVANRKRIIREMTQIKNRFVRWFAIYFPEYREVFGGYEAQSSMPLLKAACTPEAIVELGAEEINQIWRDAKLRAVGMKRATTLHEVAKRSIGLKKGSSAARYEMKLLLADYEYKKAQLDSIIHDLWPRGMA